MAPNCRGVIFLDPYAADVEYKTIKEIARLEHLDLWMLFPIHAIQRMLSRDKEHTTEKKLTIVYGNDTWKKLYNTPQATLNDTKIRHRREKGTEKFVKLYKEQLQKTFGDRLLDKSLTLKNSRDSPLFELIFCTGSTNPRAIKVSHSIAKHIIEYHKPQQKTMGEYS